ncbi:MAG: type II secretion system F family protein [Planctomycetales bacterium]|nr:type II secretion system F family protein [Planctomycetales bacterium]
MILTDVQLILLGVIAVGSLLAIVAMLSRSGDAAVSDRMAEFTRPKSTRAQREQKASKAALPKIGKLIMPDEESRQEKLSSRMLQAGLYQRNSSAFYMGVKFLLMVMPLGVGILLFVSGMLPLYQGILFGVVVGLLGTVLPAAWLNHLKSKRQQNIRRALPDALDVTVVCLEGGLSLPAALDRVAAELKGAHPLLASEMEIVRREIQLGRTTGEALREFAERFDVEELRSMASVITQAEKFGASIVKAMRVHADSMRIRRYQYAEAMAQKAPVKLIFPTVLCIFPALYIVLMGPAGVRLKQMLDNM